MVDRTIFWDQNQSRTFDYQANEHDTLYGISLSMSDTLGSAMTVINGLLASQSTPSPSLTINISSGRIYALAPADATAIGAIPQDLVDIVQQGFYSGGQLTLTTAGLSAGQSRWALVQAEFSQQDGIRSGDPNAGLLFFYNSANPAEPFEGPGDDGATTPTVRQGLCVVNVLYGTPATTGSEVPPTPSTGFAPLYLIDLTFGQTTITNGEILVSGPSVGTGVPSNYPIAPFLAGLLNSHHDGNPGQAPQIKLASEVQGLLPVVNQAPQYANTAVYTINGGVQQVSINGGAFTNTGAGNLPAIASGRAVHFRMWGAGGGGGGCNGGTNNSGTCGGGGEYNEAIWISDGTTPVVSIGAGGTGGIGGGAAPGTGGATFVAGVSSSIGGGAGSNNMGAAGAGGTGGSGGYFRIPGGSSGTFWVQNGGAITFAAAGTGFGMPGQQPGSGNSAGPNQTLPACGGIAAITNAGSTFNGGQGGPGYVIANW